MRSFTTALALAGALLAGGAMPAAQAQSAVCTGVPAWNSATIYSPGDRLVFSNRLYEAQSPIWNTRPDHCPSCGWYVDLGACGPADGNQPPSVALTAPAQGASFTAGTAITLTATAADSDGQVVSVEFFAGTTSLGVDSSAPWSVSWANAPVGSHSLTAVARDDEGATTRSAAVTVSVTANGGGGGSCHPAWAAGTVYTGGQRVTHQGRNYEARWWTQGDDPAQSGQWGPWRDLGACQDTPDTTPPSVPTGLASSSRTSTTISLGWNASTDNAGGSGVAGYDVYRNGSLVGSPTGTSYVDSGLAPATSYSYRVRARDNAGNASAQSPAISVSTLASEPTCAQAPAVPTGLASPSRTSSSVSLSWNAVAAGPGCTVTYRVFRGTQQVAQVSGTSHTVSGLSADTAYSFRVAAVNQAGASAQSAALSVRTLAGGGGGSQRVVGYFTAWGIYGRNYFVRDIVTSGSAQHLTHVFYAFGNVRNNRCEVGVNMPANPDTGAGGDAWADYGRSFTAAQSVDGVADTWDQPLRGNWNQLRKLKQQYPNIKVMISLGGWTWSRGFSEAARPENREAFVASCINAYIRGNLPVVDGAGGPGSAAGVFDGIDLDWEYPVACGLACGRPEDRENFTALLAEFRRQLDAINPDLELAAAVGAGIDKIRVTDPGDYHQYLDFINVMTYDFHGAWEPRTNHHTPLYPSPADPSTGDARFYNTDDALKAFLDRGVPAHKLTIGIGFYGRGWTNVPNVNNGLYQSGSAAPGTYEAGIEDYKVLRNLNWPSYRDPVAGAHWIYNGSTFWSFDDPQLIREKMAYARSLGLGGAFFWEFSGDDAQGSLVKAIADGLK